jgi:hypothetical protein
MRIKTDFGTVPVTEQIRESGDNLLQDDFAFDGDSLDSWQIFYSPEASFNRLYFNTELEALVLQKAEMGCA